MLYRGFGDQSSAFNPRVAAPVNPITLGSVDRIGTGNVSQRFKDSYGTILAGDGDKSR
jgi:hypothetical protein